ncbi:hypothetical protein ACPXB5_08325 [Micromonospora arida]|uniref:hypothetical protein n=1 Tax=Micromonospora arida TaxID=2203715 RepID=UPI003CF32821
MPQLAGVADAYDIGLGLAPVGASPTEEATHFLGPELEHIEIATPSTSYAATVLLDLAVAANLPETYLFILNELLAAGAKPTLTVADETRAQWGVARDGLALIPVVRYTESWTGSIGQADHHLADDTPVLRPGTPSPCQHCPATGTPGGRFSA